MLTGKPKDNDIQVAVALEKPKMAYATAVGTVTGSTALTEGSSPVFKEEEDLQVKRRRITEKVPVRVSNTSGSSADSGVGDFHQVMEADSMHHGDAEDEEEFVLLDLDSVSAQVDILPNAPYVLSGLDTLNPILIIDDKFKLIGEYQETIGTCLVFSEDEAPPMLHEETGPSEANLFSGKYIIDQNQALTKQVTPVARLQKILKFRLLLDNVQDTS